MNRSINVQLADLDINYAVFGNGKKSLVLLPGLSVTKVSPIVDFIEARYKALCSIYTVYVIDRRNDVPSRYPIKDMASDTLRLIEYIGLNNFDLLGVSQGGMIAQELVCLVPNKVNELVLVSSCNKTTKKLKRMSKIWIKSAKLQNYSAICESFYRQMFSDEFPKKYDELPKRIYNEDELRRFVILTKSLLNFKCKNITKKLACPTFVIASEKDKVIGVEGSEQLIEKLHCEYYFYDEYGHGIYDEAPDFVSKVKEFLIK